MKYNINGKLLKKEELEEIVEIYITVAGFLGADLEGETIDFLNNRLYIDGDNFKGMKGIHKDLQRITESFWDDTIFMDQKGLNVSELIFEE